MIVGHRDSSVCRVDRASCFDSPAVYRQGFLSAFYTADWDLCMLLSVIEMQGLGMRCGSQYPGLGPSCFKRLS